MKTDQKDKKYAEFLISQKILIYDPKEKRFLVLKVNESLWSKEALSAYGTWDLPGGRIQKDEDREESLVMEVAEEIGKVDFEIVGNVHLVDASSSNRRTLRPIILGYYLGGEVTLSDEHEEYKWIEKKEIDANKEYYPWLKESIRNAQKLIDSEQNLAGWRRCMADFENYKKRQQESQKDSIRYASQGIVLELLPIIDNFQASTGHVPEDQKDDPWVIGIMHIQKQLEQVLADQGVTEVPAKPGDPFDPLLHEAVEDKGCLPCEGENKFQNRIKRVVLRGYKIGNKVLRPARVTVE